MRAKNKQLTHILRMKVEGEFGGADLVRIKVTKKMKLQDRELELTCFKHPAWVQSWNLNKDQPWFQTLFKENILVLNQLHPITSIVLQHKEDFSPIHYYENTTFKTVLVNVTQTILPNMRDVWYKIGCSSFVCMTQDKQVCDMYMHMHHIITYVRIQYRSIQKVLPNG